MFDHPSPLPSRPTPDAPSRVSPRRAAWVAPRLAELPPLRALTLQSGGIVGGQSMFP